LSSCQRERIFAKREEDVRNCNIAERRERSLSLEVQREKERESNDSVKHCVTLFFHSYFLRSHPLPPPCLPEEELSWRSSFSATVGSSLPPFPFRGFIVRQISFFLRAFQPLSSLLPLFRYVNSFYIRLVYILEFFVFLFGSQWPLLPLLKSLSHLQLRLVDLLLAEFYRFFFFIISFEITVWCCCWCFAGWGRRLWWTSILRFLYRNSCLCLLLLLF